MVVYHFCYDLDYFRLARFDFYHSPFWRGSRILILSLFLGVVGVSLSLASSPVLRWRSFLARLARIAGCAALVSAGSYLLFPQRWIYFGVLHFIAIASFLALPFLRLGPANLAVGATLLIVGHAVRLAWFDHPALRWIGMMTYKPPTEDYVPVIPWLGVVLLGIFVGQHVYGKSAPPAWATARYSRPAASVLAATGRHSLMIYMLHQPVLMGAMLLLGIAGHRP
jgi:uncharacterized membrane protein